MPQRYTRIAIFDAGNSVIGIYELLSGSRQTRKFYRAASNWVREGFAAYVIVSTTFL